MNTSKIKQAIDKCYYAVTQFIDFFRYDLPRFVKNVWLFRKDLYQYRWYSGQHAVLPFMRTALKDMSLLIDVYGNEERTSKSKKIAKMNRAVELIQNFIDEDFIELAEEEIGALHLYESDFVESSPGLYRMVDSLTDEEMQHNRKVYERAREIEEELWIELWEIIKGQNYDEYIEFSKKPKNKTNTWDKWFDGTGLRGWWD